MMTFYNSCVTWPAHDVDAKGGLSDMIDEAYEISRRTFLKQVDRCELRDLDDALGYAPRPRQGLTMARDYHVSYHRSLLHGRRVYFFNHSAIEYVFTERRTQ